MARSVKEQEPEGVPLSPTEGETAWGGGAVAWAALVALTLVAYIPVFGAGTIWDDDWYMTENVLLRSAEGLARIWVPGETPQYYPVVFTTFWLEHQLWGTDPSGYHVVNVLLHACGALLVWRLAARLRVPGAWFVAAVFAVHPVHVESVAWITERKNVLSGVLYLLAALAYLRFDEACEMRRPGARVAYAVALASFVLALLSKSVTCTLPAALVLMLVWTRQRLSVRRLLPLVPLFVVGIALGLHTAHIERTNVGATGADFDFTLLERCLIASKALLFYPLKLLAPYPLTFVYPRWELDASGAGLWPIGVVLLAAAALVVVYRKGVRGPALGFAFFAGTLFPALGFFNVYPMRFSFVADHFQYLASLGVFAVVVGGVATVLVAPAARSALGGVVLVVLATLTWRQCGDYADEETLWRSVLEHNPHAWIAHNNLAAIDASRGDFESALGRLGTALEVSTSAGATRQIHYSRARTLEQMGRYPEALAILTEQQADGGGREVDAARLYLRMGRDPEAEGMYRQALEGDDRGEALQPFALLLLSQGRDEEAIQLLEERVRDVPEDPMPYMFLADAQANAGHVDAAVETAERARTLARAANKLGLADKIGRRIQAYRGN